MAGFNETPMPEGMTLEEALATVAGIMRAQGWWKIEQNGMNTTVTLNTRVIENGWVQRNADARRHDARGSFGHGCRDRARPRMVEGRAERHEYDGHSQHEGDCPERSNSPASIKVEGGMGRPEFKDYPSDGRYLVCTLEKPAPKGAPGLWEHRDATNTGVCSKGCCDIYTCPACGRSWTDTKVS